MSSYIHELHRREYPEQVRCPHHGREFKKHGRFWKCPDYRECGCSIGSRRLVGHVTTMWIRQTRQGRLWAQGLLDERTRLWWDSWPKLFSAACLVAICWRS